MTSPTTEGRRDTTASLLAEASRQDARANRLQTIAAYWAGRAAHHLGAQDFARADEAEAKFLRAAQSEQRCLFLAVCARHSAWVIEAGERRARELFEIGRRAA